MRTVCEGGARWECESVGVQMSEFVCTSTTRCVCTCACVMGGGGRVWVCCAITPLPLWSSYENHNSLQFLVNRTNNSSSM